jgi:hypothetical protein
MTVSNKDTTLLLLFYKHSQLLTCRGVPKRERDAMRAKFHGKSFRAAALAAFVNKKRFRPFQVHHIKPISLGGDNSYENLALVEPDLHETIHDFIHAQHELRENEVRDLLIPRFPGQVWCFSYLGMRFNV